jgi:hypothetical protein
MQNMKNHVMQFNTNPLKTQKDKAENALDKAY